MAGPDWKDRLPDEVWDIFPGCVVEVDGIVLGTKDDVALQVDSAFAADSEGRLPNDPSLAIIRKINSVTV